MIETVPIHPSVNVMLHPNIPAPAAHAAAREALRVTYTTLGAVADAKRRRTPRPDVRADMKAVSGCLSELEQLHQLQGLAGADQSQVEHDIQRVDAARQALEAAL